VRISLRGGLHFLDMRVDDGRAVLDDRSVATSSDGTAQDGTSRPGPDDRLALSFRGRIAGLDVLRGVAILMVLFFHGFDGAESYQEWHGPFRFFVFLTHFGAEGVHLFFVLSGFLITGILLDSKGKPDYYRSFYIRRCLRIVPAYLLMVATLKIWGGISWNYVVASLLFVANMASLTGARTEEYGFWSLAVEEQFYLVWPLVLRNLRTNTTIRVVIAGLLLSPLARALVAFKTHGTGDAYFKTWANVDYLFYGALVAVWLREHGSKVDEVRKLARILLAISIVTVPLAMCAWSRSLPMGAECLMSGFGRLPLAWLFVALLLLALVSHSSSQESRGLFHGPLAKVASFYGFISYGLYLVHPFVWSVYSGWARFRPDPTLGNLQLIVRFVVGVGASTLIAFLSRKYFEDFFLRQRIGLRREPPSHGDKRAASTGASVR